MKWKNELDSKHLFRTFIFTHFVCFHERECTHIYMWVQTLWFASFVIFAVTSQNTLLYLSKPRIQEFCFGGPCVVSDFFFSWASWWFLLIRFKLKFSFFETLPYFPDAWRWISIVISFSTGFVDHYSNIPTFINCM